MIGHKLQGSCHGARRCLNRAEQEAKGAGRRVPLWAVVTHWDFFFLSQHLRFPWQALGLREDVFRN